MKRMALAVLVTILLAITISASEGSEVHYVVDGGLIKETYVYEYHCYDIPKLDQANPVLVHCEEWELEELARLVYWEAGAQSAVCQRAVCESIFNQLNYGNWGSELHSVIFSEGNFEPAYQLYKPEECYDQDILSNIRLIVHDIYNNGITIPARIMFFRAWYYHGWYGAVPEFEIEGVFFSSSFWCNG